MGYVKYGVVAFAAILFLFFVARLLKTPGERAVRRQADLGSRARVTAAARRTRGRRGPAADAGRAAQQPRQRRQAPDRGPRRARPGSRRAAGPRLDVRGLVPITAVMPAELEPRKSHSPVRSSVPGRKKAAVLLVSLGTERAADVFRHLRDDEIESLSLEMAKLQRVEPGDDRGRARGAGRDGHGV